MHDDLFVIVLLAPSVSNIVTLAQVVVISLRLPHPAISCTHCSSSSWSQVYFPIVYDIKYLMKFCTNLHGGLNKLAETLEVERIGPQHQVLICVMNLTFVMSACQSLGPAMQCTSGAPQAAVQPP